MGNLTKIPHSELTATLEILEHLGVEERHFKMIRTDPNRASVVAQTIIGGYVMVEPKPLAPTQPIIDCDTTPHIPDGWKVKEHQKGKVAKLEKGDDLYLDGKKIEFWLSSEQKRSVITGNII